MPARASPAALNEYNVGAVDTLIGDITPPADLMKTLTDRKIAEQQQVTYDTQRMAEDERKKLEQARALADTQANVVDRGAQRGDRRLRREVGRQEGGRRGAGPRRSTPRPTPW